MRSEFEKLHEIARRIEEANNLNYDEKLNTWTSPEWDSTTCCNQDFVNAAWYAFQEQQKKLDAARKEINDFFDNQTMIPSAREYANKLADVLELLK